MSELPNCPECGSGYTYEDRDMYVCPECACEWKDEVVEADADKKLSVTQTATRCLMVIR